MNTSAQNSQYAMLAEAVKAAPPQHLANWLLTVASDALPPEQLERLGDEIGRAGHMKARQRMTR